MPGCAIRHSIKSMITNGRSLNFNQTDTAMSSAVMVNLIKEIAKGLNDRG